MSEERQPITKSELKKLVDEACKKAQENGNAVLDLRNKTISVPFNLAELLLECGQNKTTTMDPLSWAFYVDCPFILLATKAHFTQGFYTNDNDTGIIFKERVMFDNAKFQNVADFSNARFTHEVFNHAVFEGEVDFLSAHFTNASFYHTQFKEHARFSSSYFNGKSDFESARFIKGANFSDTTFSEWADFVSVNKETNFSNARFNTEAFFVDALFKGKTDFSGGKFTKTADFSNTQFTAGADFNATTFTGKTEFKKVTFTKDADFSNATFEKHVSFKEVKILTNATLNFDHITTHHYLGIIPSFFNGEIIIKDSVLESDKRSLVVDLGSLLNPLDLFFLLPKSLFSVTLVFYFLYILTLVHPRNVFFKNIEVDHGSVCLKVRNLKEGSNVEVHFEKCGFYGKNVAFTDVAMKQVSITGGNYVSGMVFYHCDWDYKKALGFFQFLSFWLKFRAFDGLKTDEIPKKAESYGNLKVSALEAGDAQLSNDFHFWHQWHQWENLYQKRLWNWNNFYRITSAYGMSVRLPLFWFLFTFLILWLPYNLLLIGHIISEKPLLVCCETLPYWIPLEGLFVSGSASIPFIFSDSELIKSLMLKDPSHLKTLGFYGLYILQHLIQGYLLFQIGAAIRNKVKR